MNYNQIDRYHDGQFLRELCSKADVMPNGSIEKSIYTCQWIGLGPMELFNKLAFWNKIHTFIDYSKAGRNDSVIYMIRNSLNSRRVRFIKENHEYLPVDISIVHVYGQITDTFEQLPTITNELGFKEINGVSLALKQSARHKIRAYAAKQTFTCYDNTWSAPYIKLAVYTAQDPSRNDETDYKFLRDIYAAIPALINSVLDDELKTFYNINEDNYNNFITTARTFQKPYDDAETIWRNMLKHNTYYSDFDKQILIKQFESLNTLYIERAKARVNVADQKITQLEEKLAEAYLKKRIANEALMGGSFPSITQADINMLINAGVSNLNIDSGSILRFKIKTPVTQYDSDAAKIYIDKQVSYDWQKQLLEAIFVKQDYVIYFEEVITMDLDKVTFSCDKSMSKYFCYNPHHYYYQCWGNYVPAIVKTLSEMDIITSIINIKSAVSSLNFTDYAVCNRFKEELDCLNFGGLRRMPCIASVEDPTTLYTVKQVLEQITHVDTTETTTATEPVEPNF